MNAKNPHMALLLATVLLAGTPATGTPAPELHEQMYAGTSNKNLLPTHDTLCGLLDVQVRSGGACFQAPPGLGTVTISIDDAVLDTPGGYLYFLDEDGEVLTPLVHFCTDYFRHKIPTGTDRVVIQFWHPLYHQEPTCTATAGTVSAFFA
jgi:hypothetical protein